jgi:hypothetical protein
VTSDGTSLTANTDYDLTWANNVNVGTATVLVTGKGGYDGCFGYKTFTINPLAASISYAETEMTSGTLNEKITNPLTKTGDGTVAYTSSNTDVATVDAATGEVTVVNGGSTTITATVTPTSNSTYATTTASYTLTVTVYRGLTSVTKDDIGKVICSNKHIHNNINAVNCGGTARAMIAYVGNGRGGKGLAIALADESEESMSISDAQTAINKKAAISGGTWHIPYAIDWKYMFIGCGNGATTSDATVNYTCFNAKIATAGGTSISSGSYYWDYWSGDQEDPSVCAYFGDTEAEPNAGNLSVSCKARAVLAF